MGNLCCCAARVAPTNIFTASDLDDISHQLELFFERVDLYKPSYVPWQRLASDADGRRSGGARPLSSFAVKACLI